MCIIVSSLLIHAVILLLNCLVLILYLCIHFVSLRCYFLYVNIILDFNITDTALKVSRSLYCFTTSLSLMVLKTISPGCGVRASLMQFFQIYLSHSSTLLCTFSYSVFTEEVECFSGLQTIIEFIQFTDSLCSLGLEAESDHCLLSHCVLSFYKLVSSSDLLVQNYEILYFFQ